MPTYQYACTECGHRFEAVQSFTDAALTECPQCTGRLRKIFSAVGVVFKGSGFYRTDSRPASATASGADGAEGASAPAAKNGKRGDAGQGSRGDGATSAGSADGKRSASTKPAATTSSTRGSAA